MTPTNFEKDDMVYHVGNPNNHGRVISVRGHVVCVGWKDIQHGEIYKDHPSVSLKAVIPFKKGDRVVFPGSSHVRLIETISQYGYLRFKDVAGEHHPDGFVKIQDGEKLSWTSVGAGDKVTFSYRDEVFTATAYKDPDLMLIQIIGNAVHSMSRFDLLSIEKAPPSLPETIGSIIRNVYSQRDAILLGNKWLYMHSGVQTLPDEWTKGWELVRDTGLDK